MRAKQINLTAYQYIIISLSIIDLSKLQSISKRKFNIFHMHTDKVIDTIRDIIAYNKIIKAQVS